MKERGKENRMGEGHTRIPRTQCASSTHIRDRFVQQRERHVKAVAPCALNEAQARSPARKRITRQQVPNNDDHQPSPHSLRGERVHLSVSDSDCLDALADECGEQCVAKCGVGRHDPEHQTGNLQ